MKGFYVEKIQNGFILSYRGSKKEIVKVFLEYTEDLMGYIERAYLDDKKAKGTIIIKKTTNEVPNTTN